MTTCTICRDPRVAVINAALRDGVRHMVVSRLFAVSRFSLYRHLRHDQLLAVDRSKARARQRSHLVEGGQGQAQAIGEPYVPTDPSPLLYAEDDLLTKLHTIQKEIDQVQSECERRSDNRGRLMALREKTRALEVEAKLVGSIQTGARSLTVNLHQARSEREELREYLEVIGVGQELVGQVLEHLESVPSCAQRTGSCLESGQLATSSHSHSHAVEVANVE